MGKRKGVLDASDRRLTAGKRGSSTDIEALALGVVMADRGTLEETIVSSAAITGVVVNL